MSSRKSSKAACTSKGFHGAYYIGAIDAIETLVNQ